MLVLIDRVGLGSRHQHIIDHHPQHIRYPQVNGIFELRIKDDADKEAVWTIDLKKTGKVTKGPSATKPDVIISASGKHSIHTTHHV